MNEPARPSALKLHDLLEPLVRHGVNFVVVGGIAGLAHGSNYPSFDLDIAYSRDRANIRRLVTALREIGVTLRGAPPDLPFQVDERTIENGANFTFVTRYGDLDVVADVGGIRSYAELLSASEETDLEGQPVRIASIDHLIAMKRSANRTKDRLMLEEYIAIAEEQDRVGEDAPS